MPSSEDDMVKKEGPIDELNIFSPDGKSVTEEEVKKALTKAAKNPVFVKEFVKKLQAHTTGTGTVVVATKRNGAGG
jgi:hypothetical protein